MDDEKSNAMTALEANSLVERYGSVHICDVPAFDDVFIEDGKFNYTVDGTTYSVPVDCVREQ